MSGGRTVWRIRHKAVTESTNRDALGGMPGDVFTARHQTAGRGRLAHRWLSPPGENLTMSAVIDVAGVSPEEVATLPLLAGLAVAESVADRIDAAQGKAVGIKWPNDVLVGGRKICGILCERNGDRVVVGIGVNVNQTVFDQAIASMSTSLRLECGGAFPLDTVRDSVLEHLAAELERWRMDGFTALWPKIAAMDFLKGRTVAIARTDDDASPATGECGGICRDGALLVNGEPVYAGSALWYNPRVF